MGSGRSNGSLQTLQPEVWALRPYSWLNSRGLPPAPAPVALSCKPGASSRKLKPFTGSLDTSRYQLILPTRTPSRRRSALQNSFSGEAVFFSSSDFRCGNYGVVQNPGEGDVPGVSESRDARPPERRSRFRDPGGAVALRGRAFRLLGRTLDRSRTGRSSRHNTAPIGHGNTP